MQKLVNAIKDHFSNIPVNYGTLGEFVYNYDYRHLEYMAHLPEITTPHDYARNILLLEPLEVVLLHWPPKVESAIHYHKGFYGYVKVMEGACMDLVYELKGRKIREQKESICLAGGIVDEPDGTIHKIVNPSGEARLVTIHFYHPALESFKGMKIYDLEKGRIGTLSEKARTASWQADFEQVEENAFTFQPHSHSHRIVYVKPKPDADTIRNMLGEYYDEQATEYDDFDVRHPTRSKYTGRVNELIAEDLRQQNNIENLLCIACGTGRRGLDIKKMSGHDMKITGVDMSSGMCEIAGKKGVTTINKTWLDAPVQDEFDAATFLYAFGHIPTEEERIASLRKIHHHLRKGGALYFDAFSLHDKNEWGPRALEAYESELKDYGYQEGDVFYKKTGGDAVAFVHYFSLDQIKKLVRESGFRLAKITCVGYVANSGEIVDSGEEGFFFVKAVKE